MDSFTPLPALFGGFLIGLAAAVLWLRNGRLAGISGIYGRLLQRPSDYLWRVVFIVALICGAGLASVLIPGLGVGGSGGSPAALVAAPIGWPVPPALWLVVSGLLIGAGTRIGNGCTSGHGVCGLARLSVRSVVAVAVFFGVAALTVAITGVV